MFTHILVPTDGSQRSTKAAAAAVQLAREHDAKITFLNVQPEYTFPVMVDLPVSFDLSQTEYQASATERARQILDEARRLAERADVRCDVQMMLHNQPWQAICQATRTLGCDLVMMASHGRRGLEAVLLGSETQRVLTHSTTPVLVYR